MSQNTASSPGRGVGVGSSRSPITDTTGTKTVDRLVGLVAAALCEYDETHDDHWYNLDTDAVAVLIAGAVHPRHEPVVIAPGIFCLVCDVPWPCPRDDLRAELERERTQNRELRSGLQELYDSVMDDKADIDPECNLMRRARAALSTGPVS